MFSVSCTNFQSPELCIFDRFYKGFRRQRRFHCHGAFFVSGTMLFGRFYKVFWQCFFLCGAQTSDHQNYALSTGFIRGSRGRDNSLFGVISGSRNHAFLTGFIRYSGRSFFPCGAQTSSHRNYAFSTGFIRGSGGRVILFAGIICHSWNDAFLTGFIRYSGWSSFSCGAQTSSHQNYTFSTGFIRGSGGRVISFVRIICCSWKYTFSTGFIRYFEQLFCALQNVVLLTVLEVWRCRRRVSIYSVQSR